MHVYLQCINTHVNELKQKKTKKKKKKKKGDPEESNIPQNQTCYYPRKV